MKKDRPEGSIIETMVIKGTTIHVMDTYIRTDPDEINKVLDELYTVAWRIVHEARARGVEI